MERNTIELTAHMIVIVDEITAIKFVFPDLSVSIVVKEVSVLVLRI